MGLEELRPHLHSLPDRPDWTPHRTSYYSDNWGFGMRLNLPIGPLRLDYGIPIHNSSGKAGAGKFQFSVGYQRPF